MRLAIAVGETIRTLRQEQNLTLRDLSSKSYVALGYLSEIERGHKDPSTEILESISKGLEVSTAELYHEIALLLGDSPEVSFASRSIKN
jgi:transcriptional regulator with XRE-family HTH domain